MVLVFKIEGLHCASCAVKIEDKLAKNRFVKSAVLNFAAKKLTVEIVSGCDIKSVTEEIKRDVKHVEPDVLVIEENAEPIKKPANSLIYFSIFAGVILTATAYFFKSELSLYFYLSGYLLIGGRVVYKAIRKLFTGKVFDEHFLMLVATVGAMVTGDYLEGIMVMLFYQVGEFFQLLAVERSRKSIVGLIGIKTDVANLCDGETVRQISPDSIKVGDIIVVKAGERISIDGVVVSGSCYVDTSSLTGESKPLEATIGTEVLGGSICVDGVLKIKAAKEYKDSTVSRIMDIIENAASKKARAESFITKFSRVYTPTVVLAAIVLAVVPVFFGQDFSEWLYRALSFLVISCPCALVISIPLSYYGAIGGASKKGLLIKGGNYLDSLCNVKNVVFDKTGTLTQGRFGISAVVPYNCEPQQLLEVAAICESRSNHPIAVSIVKAYGKEIADDFVEYKEIAGKGVLAQTRNSLLLVGNLQLMKDNGIDCGLHVAQGTAVYAAQDGKYLGYILLDDIVKESSDFAVKSLMQLGVQNIVMLTGDDEHAAKNVADKLGITQVYSRLLPDGKMEKLTEILQTGTTAFVGDGINDAPVIMRADVGMSMGALGSDAAIEASDIVIMNDDPMCVAQSIKIAKKTRKVVVQNIVFSLAFKVVVLALSAFGFANMFAAVFADVGVSLLAVLNSLRLLGGKKKNL